ncbi:hypothetical protein MKX54_20295 [Alkalihalobacillus sp. FSL R5-0424]
MGKKLILGSSILCVTILTVACNNTESVYEIYDQGDESLPQSIDEIIDNSEIIVKGEFGNLLKSENMIRNSADPTIESDLYYSEGHIYDFNIGETYKGLDVDGIKVAVTYGDGIPVMEDTGEIIDEVFVERIDYEEIDLTKQYILFLRDSSDIEENLFTPAAEAFIIEVDDDTSLKFHTKRMEGQLSDDIDVDTNDEESYGELTTQFRSEVSVDVIQEFNLFPDLLNNSDIDNLTDLEEYLN